jgi:uncharacterized protein YgiM (DUF1202 family)
MRIKMIKFISVLMAIAAVFSMFVLFIPAARAETAVSGTVNCADANLREQPSTASNIIVKMSQGSQVNVLGSAAGGWLQIAYQDKTGYVRADFVDVLTTGLSDQAVIMYDSPMSDQPGSGNVIQTLSANTQVTITGTFGAMYQVSVNSLTGYVQKSSVHKYRIIDIGLKAALNSSGVNLRSTPSTTGEILATMKKGDAVTAISLEDKWIKVSCSGKEGYIRGDFITYTVPANSHLTTLSTGMKGQAVTQVQTALKKRGFFYPAANGVYGAATKGAVAKFQTSVNLDSDGIAGPQTLLLLLGTKGAASLWSNYRSDMPAQDPQQSGKVILEDWFGGMEKVVKKYTPFEVIDVRTGIHWNMQRFGGWWHADVETMTKADTEAMTEAWGGTLDPTRRPVWVKIGDKYYAAGLMGFVHNTDTISTNGMDGQICLHFRGSKIHGSGHIDEAHQACITEAFAKAGKLDSYIDSGKV